MLTRSAEAWHPEKYSPTILQLEMAAERPKIRSHAGHGSEEIGFATEWNFRRPSP